MYDFHNLDINQRIEIEKGPSEAFNYNGHWLDQEIAGFQTLVTSGRHEFERAVNAPDRAGDGATYLSSRLTTRKIEVTFLLKAKTIAEYNVSFERLKEILAVPNVKFYFADDPVYRYRGTGTSLKLDSGELTTKGTIELETSDPYRYSEPKALAGNGTRIVVSDPALFYDQTPTRLTLTPATGVSNLLIQCGSKHINLNVGVLSGQPVTIDFDNLMVTVNRVESMMNVTLDSNIGDFYIHNGSEITCNVTGRYELIYEVKRL